MPYEEDFIEQYLDYQKDTESPTIYHRWCAISMIATALGRKVWIQFGENKIYPNMYIMLVGDAGARKSTAIKKAQAFLENINYKKFAARKTTKEKFLLDFEAGFDSMGEEEEMDVKKAIRKNPTMRHLFGDKHADKIDPEEVLIAADEFAVFIGHGNMEFIDILTDLWDYDGIYTNRIKNGRSVRIPYPTVNILSGNTNTSISEGFPPAAIGAGYFSRNIFVYSDPTGKRITIPKQGNFEQRAALIKKLNEIHILQGEITIESQAYEALDEIYQSYKFLEDVRFKTYSTRRLIHLLKLCIICATARNYRSIDVETVIKSNSILHYVEYYMPQALGEFGKARHSDVSAKILEIIDRAERPLHPIQDIWPKVRQDLDSQRQLLEILQGLRSGGKIQQIAAGLLPLKRVQKWDYPFCNIQKLREWQEEQERKGI